MDRSFWRRFAQVILLAASHIKFFRQRDKAGDNQGFSEDGESSSKFGSGK